MPDIKLKDVRLSFPDLFVAKEFKTGDGKPRYNATFLVVPGSENDKAIQAAIQAAAADVFGAKAKAILESVKGQSNKYCYLNGDLKEYDGYEGHYYLASHSKTRPLVIDRAKNPLTEQDGVIYAGCYVNATVSIYAQKGENTGIRCAFNGVQFNRDGDAFSAGAPASVDDFDSLDTAVSDGGLV
jgi:hypothetical protein